MEHHNCRNIKLFTKRGAYVILLDSFTVMFGVTIVFSRAFSSSICAVIYILGAITQTQGAFIIMISPRHHVTPFGTYCTLLGANKDALCGVSRK